MTGTPDRLIDNPDPSAIGNRNAILADVLSRIRLDGAMFLRGEYFAGWAFDSPASRDLVGLLAPGAQRLILFHIVREGHAWVSAGNLRVELGPGDVAVLPHAHRHLMGSLSGVADPIPIAELLPPTPWNGVPVCRFDGGGDRAEIVCGYLKCDDLLFNAFMRRLPAVFRVRPPEGPTADLIRACVNYAVDERAHSRHGGAPLTAHMPELLLTETLRLHSEQDASDVGWLAAINDPVLSRALVLLHAEPARRWTVEELARRSATSRSVLDERFRKRLGQSPMRYLAEWRIQLAADLMKGGRTKLTAIAHAVGYGSEEAFSRAFQRHLGDSPAHWRRRELSRGN